MNECEKKEQKSVGQEVHLHFNFVCNVRQMLEMPKKKTIDDSFRLLVLSDFRPKSKAFGQIESIVKMKTTSKIFRVPMNFPFFCLVEIL